MDSEPAVAEPAQARRPPRRLRNWYALYFLVPIALGTAGALAHATAGLGLPGGMAWAIGIAAGIAAFVVGYRRTGSGEDERFDMMSTPMNINAAQVLLLILAPFAIVGVAIGIVYVFHL
jgi:hypothetical protein